MRDETERDPQATTPTLLGMNREEWGWVVFGAGAIGTLGTALRRNRSPLEWLLGLALLGGGAAMLLHERERGIDRTQERIGAELDSLDPLARAQVLKRVASAEFKSLRGKAAESEG